MASSAKQPQDDQPAAPGRRYPLFPVRLDAHGAARQAAARTAGGCTGMS